MIKMPLNDIIAKIKEKSDISEDEINAKIDEKLKQLSGLISKEGAAHIIANELGIKLFEETTGKLQIKNILTGMRSVETVGKVIRKFDVREFNVNGRAGKVGNIVIGDETGTVRVAMWGSVADNVAKLNEGDIVKIVSGYVRENNGEKEIHMNDNSKIEINPPGEEVGEVNQTKPSAVRKKIGELKENDNNVELFGTIVQAFEPKFFEVCPQCGKRAKPTEGKFICVEHNDVEPDYSYVMNVSLDDGTESIRTVFFRQQVEKLLDKSREDVLKYKEDIASFESVKTDLMGNQIKITGRTVKNAMFERLEFMVNDVNIHPDPEEEIKRLEEA